MPRWIISTKWGVASCWDVQIGDAIWHYSILFKLEPLVTAGELLAFCADAKSWLLIADVAQGTVAKWDVDGKPVFDK